MSSWFWYSLWPNLSQREFLPYVYIRQLDDALDSSISFRNKLIMWLKYALQNMDIKWTPLFSHLKLCLLAKNLYFCVSDASRKVHKSELKDSNFPLPFWVKVKGTMNSLNLSILPSTPSSVHPFLWNCLDLKMCSCIVISPSGPSGNYRQAPNFANSVTPQPPGGRLNKKDGLTRYGDSHAKDKTS